jgi:ribosomal protein S20
MIKQSIIKKQIYRVRTEMRRVQEALDAGDAQALYAAFERAQHAAFDGKAYVVGGTLPDEEAAA